MSGFRRLVLELGHGAVDAEALRQAAAFAQLLDAELHALFIEDDTLVHASGLPFAREISPLSYQWRKLEPERLATDQRAAAERARRRLIEAATASGVRQHFEIRRGDLALHVIETCVASDIVVVGPRGATHGARQLRETARRSAAAVLYLPAKPIRRRGPVVALVSGPQDPARPVAERIAALAHERLLVLPAGTALGDTGERLIVHTRVASPDGPELAAARGVPVLVVEPAATAPA